MMSLGRNGKGTVLVGAAGNGGQAGVYNVWYPAKLPSFVAVGASNKLDRKFLYSSYGVKLDVLAPSGYRWPNETDYNPAVEDTQTEFWTTDITGTGGMNTNWAADPADNNKYTKWFDGTSGAAPIVSGIAALLLHDDESLTAGQVQAYIRFSAKDLTGGDGYETGRDLRSGYGRVDAYEGLVESVTPPVMQLHQPRQFSQSHGAPAQVHDTAHYFTRWGDYGNEFNITTGTATTAQPTDFVVISTQTSYSPETSYSPPARFDVSGDLTLIGVVTEDVDPNADLSNAVVIMRGNSGETLSFIDRAGNLKVRRSTYVGEKPDMGTQKFE